MTILKSILGTILICTALVSFITGNFGGITFMFLGIILLPPISDTLREKFSYWNHRSVRYVSYFLIFISTALFVKPKELQPNEIKNKSNKNNSVNSKVKSENDKYVYDGNGELVSDKKETVAIDELKWSRNLNPIDLNGSWLLIYYSTSNKEYYINDGNEEQKRLKLGNSTYQTTYPNGGGDNPEFNYNIENEELIVKMKSQLASEIYRFRVSISNDKKYLRLIENQNSIQVFKREN